VTDWCPTERRIRRSSNQRTRCPERPVDRSSGWPLHQIAVETLIVGARKPAAGVTVLVADDHPVYREGVARAIRERPELELVAECADGTDALLEIEAQQPDVAVLDLGMPDADGMHVLASLAALNHQPRTLVLSADIESATVYQAISLGASGYLAKDASRRQICDAVIAISRGETVLGPGLAGGLAEQVRSRRDHDRPILSRREQEVLKLTAEGWTRAQIAAELHLSPTTVKTHMEHVYEKLDVTDRAAAVATALRRGILT
jgi:two-component system nitrate/nitrite response regulator NarL